MVEINLGKCVEQGKSPEWKLAEDSHLGGEGGMQEEEPRGGGKVKTR